MTARRCSTPSQSDQPTGAQTRRFREWAAEFNRLLDQATGSADVFSAASVLPDAAHADDARDPVA